MVEDPELVDRLENWKFCSAMDVLEALPSGTVSQEDRDLIDALSTMFGNCGYFRGSMGFIVCSAVELLTQKPQTPITADKR